MWFTNPVPLTQRTYGKTAPKLQGPTREPEAPSYLMGSRGSRSRHVCSIKLHARARLPQPRPTSWAINLFRPAETQLLPGHKGLVLNIAARVLCGGSLRVARGGGRWR